MTATAGSTGSTGGAEGGSGDGGGGGVDEGVVMYWRPGCVFCMKLRLSLLSTKLAYRKRNIWQDKDAAAFVRSVADGNETVPTVTVAGHAMVNPSKKDLLAAVRQYAPHLLPPA